MKLSDVIRGIAQLNETDFIYALEPWGSDSEAMVVPYEAVDEAQFDRLGSLAYFCEVFAIREYFDGHFSEPYSNLSDDDIERVIHFAKYDA